MGYPAARRRPIRELTDLRGALTRQRLDRAHERIERGQLPELGEFDLINGLAGIGVYLLQAHNTGLLRDVLSHLVRLVVEPVTVDDQKLPGWWTGNGPTDRPSTDWPGGHSNLGLAHGISGPAMLKASTMSLGVAVPSHADAIARICAELDQWRCASTGRSWWPGIISPAEWKTGLVSQPREHRRARIPRGCLPAHRFANP
ncbi:MAG: lanthionine synthetase LanC family protein [Pseudonocardiaceae bacterium]